jgi:putative transposase
MPRKNSTKIYVENGIYHIYNRGVEKRIIFIDDQDYVVFLRFLKDALAQPPKPKSVDFTITLKGSTLKGTFQGLQKQPLNFYKKCELLAYCLMPNHFHLLIKQSEKSTIKHFMQSVVTRYSMYFNKKYKRVGSLFQGIYKAILVLDDSYLLHLSRYIHRNPLEIKSDYNYKYSSYINYIGKQDTSWINTDIILSNFGSSLAHISGTNSYQIFVEKWKNEEELSLGRLTLEETP